MTPTETPSRQRSQAAIRIGLVAAVVVAAFGSGPQASAQFTPGNVVVLRIGNGTTLSTSAAPGTLIEINSATGVPTGYTVALPTAAAANNGGITFSGNATTAAHLHRSTDGMFLTAVGYDAPVGSSVVAQSSSLTYGRTIVRIDGSGLAVTQRLTDETFSASDARSAISDGTRYWLGGNASSTTFRGVRHVANSSATTSNRLVSADVRDVNIFNNRLFYSTSGGINAVTGSPPPTGGTVTTTPVTAGNNNVNGFVFFDRDAGVGAPDLGGLDTLYFADGTNILKLEYSSGSWSPRGSFNSSNLNNVNFGLTGALNGGTVELYATETGANGSLVKITDTTAFGGTMFATDVWSLPAGANFTYRGVDFTPTPVPEPGTALAVAAIGLGLARLWRRQVSPGRPTP
jgi:hypothetical protein